MLKTYNSNFLNSFFTSNEFDFIEHMDSDIEASQKMLEQQQKNRDIIVNLINSLNDAIYYNGLNNVSSEKETRILEASKNVFELINYNINMLQSNNELSSSVQKEIVDLLIQIDSNGENVPQDNYTSIITNLKNKISDISSKLEDSKSKIQSNNNAIVEFLNSESTKEFLDKFSIQYNNGTNLNIDSSEVNEADTNDISDIELNTSLEDNNLLLVSEKKKKVYLPYSKKEVLEYLKQYPEQYSSPEDVIKSEFVFSTDLYLKHPVVARFREAYALIRDREAKSVLDAFKYAMEIMFNYNLNPVIIAACKSQAQLDHYLKCLQDNDLSKFTDFEIKFEVAPLKV